MTESYGNIQPIVPFPQPIPVPTVAPDNEGDLIFIQVSKSWVKYIAGACNALQALSTWDTTDDATLNQVRVWVYRLQEILATWITMADLIKFRENPVNGVYWDYSTDGGVTYTRQPDTISHMTPVFSYDGTSPSSTDLSINNGVTTGQVPVIDGIVDNAVRSNPASDLVNTISTATGITPLELISGGTVSMLINSQERAIDIARKAGFDTSLGEEFLRITKAVADAGDVLVTVLLT